MVIDEPLGNLLIVVFTGDHTGGPSPWRVGLLKISHVCRDRCYDNLTGGLLAVAESWSSINISHTRQVCPGVPKQRSIALSTHLGLDVVIDLLVSKGLGRKDAKEVLGVDTHVSSDGRHPGRSHGRAITKPGVDGGHLVMHLKGYRVHPGLPAADIWGPNEHGC